MFKWKPVLYLAIVAVVAFVVSLYVYGGFISIATALFLSVLGITLLLFMDDIGFKHVDTKKEIVDNRNIAYAIYMLGLSIIIGAGIIGAMLVFATTR